jgi:hypothetical protein
MEGANLTRAQLEGAKLVGAHLQGAILKRAWLHDADLSDANLRGADLNHANLKGAELDGAHLEGADLSEASLVAADLTGANMTGANAWGGNLEATKLSGAVLAGAVLGKAHLEWADLSYVDLNDAELSETVVANNNLYGAETETLVIHSVKFGKKLDADKRDKLIAAEKSPTAVEGWNGLLKSGDEDGASQAAWLEIKKASEALDPDGAAHRRRLAKLFGDLACDHDGGDIFRGILRQTIHPKQPLLQRSLRRHRLSELGDQLIALENRLVDDKNGPSCLGMADFPTSELRDLEQLEKVHGK